MINLTQHKASPEQTAQGLVDLFEPERVKLTKLLTFDILPGMLEIHSRAIEIVSLMRIATPFSSKAMIGGAPFLMASLEKNLRKEGITPFYSFSTRESTEQIQPDGSTKKIAIFKHKGWVIAVPL